MIRSVEVGNQRLYPEFPRLDAIIVGGCQSLFDVAGASRVKDSYVMTLREQVLRQLAD